MASLGLENPRRASAGPVFVQQWRLRGQSGPGQQFYGSAPRPSKPRRASAGPVFVQQWRLRGQPGPGQQFYGFRKRRMAPRPSKPSPRLSRRLRGQPSPGQQLYRFRKRRMAPRPSKPSPRLSRPSLCPAMAPPWPTRPWTAVISLPKATDGTSAFKTLAAPQPAQSSSSNGASVANQALDSSSMASESDGWHLGLQNPRRASAGPVFVQQWPPWPAKPWTAVLRLPKATDGTSAFKTLATPQPAQSSSSNGASVASQALDSSYIASESDGWHLGLENPRRASAGPVFIQQWRLRGQLPKETDGTSGLNTEAIVMIPKQLQTSRLQLSKDITYLEDRRVTFNCFETSSRFYHLPPSRCLPVSTARL